MNTLAEALAPRSDQLNADDLIPGPRVLKITNARIAKDGRDIKVVLNFDGDNGKPWKPCKTMGRAMVMAWAVTDESQMVGKSVRVYRDPEVKFGDQGAVGGIRISHMSHITKPAIIKLTVSQGKKGTFTFHPLVTEQPRDQASEQPGLTLDQARADLNAATSLDALKVAWTRRAMAPHRDALTGLLDERKAALAFDTQEGPDDTQRGEAHATEASLAEAKADIDACEIVADINACVAEWCERLSEDDGDELHVHAGVRKTEMGPK